MIDKINSDIFHIDKDEKIKYTIGYNNKMIEKEAKELFLGDQAQRCKRLETNCKFLLSQIEKIHTALCSTEIGTWQEWAEQAAEKVVQIAKDFQNAMDIIGKQTYELSVLRNGLKRLKNDRDWQSVEEVDAYIDSLLAVQNE